MAWSHRGSTPESVSSSSRSPTPGSPFSDSSAGSSRLFRCRADRPKASTATQEVLDNVLRVRKTWKTQRGGECVWPPDLEAALLEGLEKYEPRDSRETRLLGRFPRRNRFISDYIYEKTGKQRSPKQVGSRLQQMRESCGGERLLQLLSPFGSSSARSPTPHSSASSPSSSPLPLPHLPPPAVDLEQDSVPDAVMYIDLIGPADPFRWTEEPDDGLVDAAHFCAQPRHIQDINPTVSFTSLSSMDAYSCFTVRAEGRVLHAEKAPLMQIGTSPAGVGYIYSTALVPKYWRVILDCPDPTRFTITHRVVQDKSAEVLFSTRYQFRYRAPQGMSLPAFAPSTALFDGSPESLSLGQPYDAFAGGPIPDLWNGVGLSEPQPWASFFDGTGFDMGLASRVFDATTHFSAASAPMLPYIL